MKSRINTKNIVLALLVLIFLTLPALVADTDFALRWQHEIAIGRERFLACGKAVSAIVLIFACTILVALGLPRTWLSIPVSAIFGAVVGTAISLMASIFGSYLTFVVVKRYGRDLATRAASGHEELRILLGKAPGIASIAAIRQIPLPGIIISVALAISECSHKSFLLGTFLGYALSTLIICLAASSVTYAGV